MLYEMEESPNLTLPKFLTIENCEVQDSFCFNPLTFEIVNFADIDNQNHLLLASKLCCTCPFS